MFITREDYEKALRRARAEGRKEALKEFRLQDDLNSIQRCFNDRMDRLRERIDCVHTQVIEVKEKTDAKSVHTCTCKSDE